LIHLDPRLCLITSYLVLLSAFLTKVAWKGSDAILGPSMDQAAKQTLTKYRREIGSLHKEEALLDHWIDFLQKASAARAEPLSADAADILQALLYHNDDNTNEEPPSKEALVDDAGKPKQAFLAVHTPYNGIAHVPAQSSAAAEVEEDRPQQQHKLYVGSLATFKPDDDNDDETNAKTNDDTSDGANKRRKILRLQSPKLAPRHGDQIQVLLLPVEFDNQTQKLTSRGVQPMAIPNVADIVEEAAAAAAAAPPSLLAGSSTLDPLAPTTGWEQVAEALADDEGVSDFFAAAENEAA